MFRHPSEFVRFKASPHLPGVELYTARLVDHAFAPHVHESYSLGAIEAGVERFRYKGSDHVAPADTLVTLNADEVHTGQAESAAGWTYQMLYIEPDTLRALTGTEVYFPQAAVHDPQLARAYRGVFARMWQAGDDVAFTCEFTVLVDALVARYGAKVRAEPTASPARMRRSLAMRRVLDCIEANLEGSLRIETLAAEANLSLFHFVRVFVATFNCTPQQYVQARRVLRAKGMLARSVSPALAAGAVGLTDQSHLNRWFKRSYGVTPAQYQQQIGTRPPR
ncbi:AraC-like DNA-binding protein [Janthinobacterium sp. CG_23.3]|uniref:AraC family transcriptional regulator n=1 Tax=unclassified Janthinobacterium TaxID=2610881 RepID=UPI000349E72E|nr:MULTISPECIES: AraC family transcriptional regulator [unclassified Janthinobacterium]MEC5159948.1 AraC-like DNA-binding protein [Janthinobacterium sp. CG_S6]